MGKQRIRNPRLLKQVGLEPCAICFREGPNDPHHIKTRGAGGPDLGWNLISLCRNHHQAIHQLGIKQLLKLYPFFRARLKRMGWDFDGLKPFNINQDKRFDEEDVEATWRDDEE